MPQLEYFIPDDIPSEVKVYEAELKQLKVGRAGKLGALLLHFEHDIDSNKTIIKKQYSKVPLFSQRALYLEESLPSMAYVYIISPSGGILQGDRYRIDISLHNNAYVHITTQGATRVYRMNLNYATQIINIDVDANCYLEYIPDQIIPYRDSRFYQKVNLKVHDNATLVYSEMVVPGRVARGESFEYDVCYMKTIARNQDDRLSFVDIAVLEPKKREVRVLGVLDGYDVIGNIYILTKKEYVSKLNDEINLLVNSFKDVYGGSTILPYNSGVMIRLLGDTASNLRGVIYKIVELVRRILLNASFSRMRKG